MPDFLNTIIAATAGLLGVGLGGAITLFNQRRQRADERIQRQLSEFYAPFLGIRMRILAKSELRVKSSGAHGAAWAELFAVPRAQGNTELLKKITDEKWPAFEEAQKYSEREWIEEIVPLYRRMLDLFTDKMWLAEPSTRRHFGVLVEFVEIWNRYIAGGIANEAVPLLGHDEDKVKPLYEDVANHVEGLSEKLRRSAVVQRSHVKRGLARLYLVLAAIWILGGFLYEYRTEKAIQDSACSPFVEQGVTRLPFTANPSLQQPEGVRVQGPDGQQYLFPTGTTKADAISYFKRQREAQHTCETTTPVRSALLVAFVPAVLGFGFLQIIFLAAIWVRGGFSEK